MQQNAPILKLFSKIPLFFKINFNKIEFCVRLDFLKIEFYVYFLVELDISNVKFHLNFQKILSDKIYIELYIANVEFHTYNLILLKSSLKNRNILLNSFKTRAF